MLDDHVMDRKRSIVRHVIHLALVIVAAGCAPGAEPELPPESEVRAAAARALGCLTAMQATNGSFYQGSDDDFADWETANVVLGAAPWLPSGDARLATARAYLAAEQRKDGTWAPGPRQEDLSCLETTAVAVAAMTPHHPKQQKAGCAFLLGKQRSDGAWPIGLPMGDATVNHYPSVTGFVINTLKVASPSATSAMAAGRQFLLAAQKTDGSWGSHFGFYDTPHYAIYQAIPALGVEHSASSRALDFVVSQQNEDGSWGRDFVGSNQRPSHELRTILALRGLVLSSAWPHGHALARGLAWLLPRQETSGCWPGGYFVNYYPHKTEDVYTTAAALLLLHQVVGKIQGGD